MELRSGLRSALKAAKGEGAAPDNLLPVWLIPDAIPHNLEGILDYQKRLGIDILNDAFDPVQLTHAHNGIQDPFGFAAVPALSMELRDPPIHPVHDFFRNFGPLIRDDENGLAFADSRDDKLHHTCGYININE